MKKLLIVLFAVIIMSTVCGCNNQNADNSKAPVSDEPASVLLLYKTIDYSGTGEKYSESVYDYNNAGKVVKLLNYGSDGSLTSEIYYEYNDNGSITREYGKVPKTESFMYDHRYEYDANGFLVSKKSLDENENIIQHQICKYDEKGRILSVTIEGEEGRVKNYVYSSDDSYTETYDRFTKNYSADDRILVEKYGADGDSDAFTAVYEYDSQNRLILITNTSANGDIVKGQNIYNQSGLLEKRVETDKNGDTEREYSYTYDENGNQIESLIKNAIGVIINRTVSEYKEFVVE